MRRTLGRSLALTMMALMTIGVWATPAAAHTDFESSTPTDGEVIDTPVAEITISFTSTATPSGEGFVVLDATGAVRSPDEVTAVDDSAFVLAFDPALAGGTIGVRWTVAAPDTHPINGAFSFSVTAPLPTTTTTGAPTTTAEGTPETTAPPTTTEVDHSDHADHAEHLDEFLATDAHTAGGAKALGTVGRALTYVGAIVAIGALMFAWRVAGGDDAARSRALTIARAASPLLVVGAVVDGVAHVATVHGHWSALESLSDISDALDSSFGAAIGLRVLGGLLLVAGLSRHLLGSSGATRDRASSAGASLSGAGAGAIAISFAFTGHTVSEGPRWLHALSSLTHVAAASVWIGGLAVLAAIAWNRRTSETAPPIATLAVRFSVVATVAIVAVGVAGVALSVIIIDSPSQLWSSDWGRLLIVKAVLVALAGAGGAYNHRVLVPEMERTPGAGTLEERFRRIIAFELVAAFGVVVATAALVAAAL